jgi:Zn-dependent protease
MRKPLFRFENPIRLDTRTKIGRLRGVDLYVHWTVFAVAALILAGVARRPLLSVVGLTAFLSVLLIHEAGHLIAAQRKGCEVISIELYPFFGFTQFGTPWSGFDHCVIAWGGVIAQAVVAIPILVLVELFGYSRFEAVNMLIAILCYYSIFVAFFNLLPIRPLDGSVAWGIIPAWFAERRLRRPR